MICLSRFAEHPSWTFLVVFATLWLPGTTAAAEAPTATGVDVSIGYAGHYKVGYWAPVFVSFDYKGGAGDLTVDVTVPDGDAMPSTTTATCRAAGGGGAERIDVELYCKVGRIDGEIAIAIRDKDSTLARGRYALNELGPAPLPSDAKLLVALGNVPNFRKAIANRSHDMTTPIVVASLSSEQRLPTNWYGFDSADMVVISGSRPETHAILRDSAARSALAEWIRNGGKLLLMVGSDAGQLIGDGALLADFAPGKFVDVMATRKLTPLESFAVADDPLFKEDNVGQAVDFLIPYFDAVDGTVDVELAAEGRRVPLVARRVVGFGVITYLAVDLEKPEFKIWNGTQRLVGKLVFAASSVRQERRGDKPGELAHVGYDDLSGQLRAALDRFEQQGVTFIPFVVLLLFGVFYLLLIAPGDYFFLKRVVKRMELTWVTFPALVAVACLSAYLLARTAKGDRQLLNQAELVDIDVTTGQVRATCWFSIFSPETQRYDLQANWHFPIKQQPGNNAQAQEAGFGDQIVMSWQGLPGKSLGGMQSRAATPQFDIAYRYGPGLESMIEVPIQIWSTKCFTARYQGHVPTPLQANLTVRAAGRDKFIRGHIVNPLDVALRDCTLFHDQWVYALGTIEPGQKLAVNQDDFQIRSLRNHLTRFGEWRTETEEQRHDVSRIFDRMMFYNSAGGRDSTPLKNSYLTQVDMTNLLSTERAVLVAHIEKETFELKGNQNTLSYPGALRSATIRFLVPVEQTLAQ